MTTIRVLKQSVILDQLNINQINDVLKNNFGVSEFIIDRVGALLKLTGFLIDNNLRLVINSNGFILLIEWDKTK